MLRVEEVSHHYGFVRTLRGVSMAAASGELVCVMGGNGAGKSTLLKVIAGVEPALGGRVLIDGVQRRSTPAAEETLRRRCVYLPAEPWLPLPHTPREYLFAVGALYRVPTERRLEHADRLLAAFDLADKADARLQDHSTGQRKKVAIAGALLADAGLLVLDEPLSGGLDASGLLAVTTILRHLAEDLGRAVVFAVPVPELVEGLAHRVVLLRGGRVAGDGTPAELKERGGEATFGASRWAGC